MRITPNVLLQHAKHYVRERAKKDRSLTCVYLAGSMLEEEPFINGVGDIDLIFVHAFPENMEREIVAITDEIHFDIQHHLQTAYEDPKLLRRDAWLGDTLWQKPTVFFEKNHWFDFILAGAFSQFTSAENILGRSKRFTGLARAIQQKAIFDLGASASLTRLRYLLAIEASANGLVSLVGSPLPLRRMLLDFPTCAADLGKPEMTAQMISLYSQTIPDQAQLNTWINDWALDYQAASARPDCPTSLHPLKQPYYEEAMRTQLNELPAAALWITAWVENMWENLLMIFCRQPGSPKSHLKSALTPSMPGLISSKTCKTSAQQLKDWPPSASGKKTTSLHLWGNGIKIGVVLFQPINNLLTFLWISGGKLWIIGEECGQLKFFARFFKKEYPHMWGLSF